MQDLTSPREKRAMYEAFKASDTRFDGRVFVGVSSTGVYCRPICHARMPKYENCTFFESAAAAEAAGYRPCMLCRPELAPGLSTSDATASLARRAAVLLRERCTSGEKVDELAARLGYTDRHLRHAFEQEFQVTPVQYLQTCRLLLAKSLLTDTELPMAQVAQAAGFGSVRRFNHLFKEHYGMTPSALRTRSHRRKCPEGTISCGLGYRPPYQFDQLLEFFRVRALAGVEQVGENYYARTVRIPFGEQRRVRRAESGNAARANMPLACAKGQSGITAKHAIGNGTRRTTENSTAETAGSSETEALGWLRVENDAVHSRLVLTMSDSLLPALSQIVARVRLQFDTDCDPQVIHDGLETLDQAVPGANVPGTRVPGCFNPFETAMRAVLGQQVSVAAANKLAARIVETYGTPIETGIEGLTHVSLTPQEVANMDNIEDAFGNLGVIKTRSRTIAEIARLLCAGELDLSAAASAPDQIEALLAIKGIGPWSANYIAMRTLAYPDAFLETDAGIKHALPEYTPKQRLELAEQWRPWRSYANICLWNSLA